MTEDFERAKELDQMYLIESQKRMEEEWQEWEHEQSKEPARIELVQTLNKEKNEQQRTGSSIERGIGRE